MPHFIIVLILYINLLNLSSIKKCLFLSNMEPLKKLLANMTLNVYLEIWQIQSTLVISNFTGPDKNVRVISSSRQPNCDVIGMTTVRLSVRQNVVGRHMYMAI